MNVNPNSPKNAGRRNDANLKKIRANANNPAPNNGEGIGDITANAATANNLT